jgi:hypothetical protein
MVGKGRTTIYNINLSDSTPWYYMMNTMKFVNMDEYLDKSSSEVIISKITRGNYFHCTNIDLLKKEIDGYLKLS